MRWLVVTMLLASPVASFAQHPSMPAGMTHEEHLAALQKDADVKKRGAAAMGFDQDAVEHHFLLQTTGGVIQVEVRNASDTAARDAIRTHLREIASSFANGDFSAPFATHNEVPPGVAELQELKSELTYSFRATPGGGAVRIVTANAKALTAVHAFLRYQIAEHRTGDPVTMK
jgi:hypothetical protein